MKKFIVSLFFLTMMICNGFSQSILEEGFEGSTMLPSGWTALANSPDPIWSGWSRVSTSHSGSYAAFVDYATPSHSSFLITPQLSITGHKVLSFWFAANYPGYAYATTFTVEISTTGNNVDDFIVMDTITFPENTEYRNVVLDLQAYSGQDVYIAFHIEDREGTGVYIDDIHVYDMPTCFPPENIAVSGISMDQATITWTVDSNVVNYVVSSMDMDDPDATPSSDTVSGGTFVLGGLQSATNYSVRVRSICQDESVSTWSMVASFTTECEAFTVTADQLWTEGFENISGTGVKPLLPCWSAPITSTSYNSPYIYCGWSPAAHSGYNTLVMQANAGEANMVLLPEFTNEISTLRLEYYATTTSANLNNAGIMEVGYVTDENDPSTFVTLALVTPKDSSLGRNFSAYYGPFDLLGAPSTATRIGIRFTSNYWSTSWNLDDFTVSLVPECSGPSQLTVGEITSSTATIHWIGRDNVLYNVIYWAVGSTDTVHLSNIPYSTVGYTLLGLDNNADYQCVVQTVCANGTVIPANSAVTFATLGNTLQLPYLNDFEEGPDAYPEINIFGMGNNQWAIGSGAGHPGNSMYISDDNGISNHYTNVSAQVSDYSHSYAVLNVTFPPGDNEYHLSFDYRVVGEVNYDMFYVFMANSNATVNVGDLPPGLQLLGRQANVPEWTNVDLMLSNVAGTTKQIIFYWVSDNLIFNNPPVAVDNISISYFSCPQPTNLYVSGVSSDAATLYWMDNSSSSWVVYYRPAYSQEPYHEEIVDDGPYFSFTSLYSNTIYDCYVVARCDDGEMSSPSTHYQFRTACGGGIGSLPYVESFDDYVTVEGSDYVPCWTRFSSNSQHFVYVNRMDFESSCLDFHYTPNCFTMAVMPSLSNEIAVNSVVVEFDAKKQYLSEGSLEVGVLSNPNNPSTFEVLSTIEFSAAGTWEHKVVYCDHYSGNGSNFAIRVSNAGNHYVLVDNVQIDYLPSCLPASDLSVSDVTLNGATLSWRCNSFEYNVYVIGADTAVYTVSDTFLVLTGLQSSTSYGFMVESLCGSDTAAMSPIASFFTECGNISVSNGHPWAETFENYHGLPETAIAFSPCWATPLTYTATNGVFPTVYNYAPAAHSGTNMVEIKGHEVMLVLPTFSTVLSSLRLSFWANTTAHLPENAGLMEIGIVNGTNPASFIPWDTVEMTAFNLTGTDSPNSDLMGPYDFAGATVGPFSRIAIRYRSDLDYVSCYLDDFTVSMIPDCSSPVKNSVTVSNLTESSANISWEDRNPNHTQWIVYYKKSSEDEESWMSTDATSTSVTLYNLDPNIQYDVYVVTNCGQPGTDATRTVHFTTTLVSVSLPFSTNFSNPTEWTLSNGTCPNRWMIGSIGSSTNGLFVSYNNITPGYDEYSSSLVTAEKVFTVGDDAEFMISFDVRVGGESNNNWGGSDYDYMKVFFAPTTEEYGAHNPDEEVVDWASSSYPLYAVNFSDYLSQTSANLSTPYKFAMTGGNTVHVSVNMPNPNITPTATSTAKLVFMWYNDLTDGTQPAAVISNLSISKIECPQPVNLTVENLSSTSADITWTGAPDVSSWVLSYKASNESTWVEETLYSPSYHFSDLGSLTTYTVQIVSNCSSGETSAIAYTTFTTTACTIEDQCSYTFNLSDSYGDGWNDAYISVMQNGVLVSNVTLSQGSSSSQTLNLCNNENISLVWNSGPYDYECSFSLIGPDGVTVIYSVNSVSAPNETVLYTFTPSCSDSSACTPPTGLSVNNVTYNSALLNWTSTSTAVSWIVEYKANGSATWYPAIPVSTSAYTLSGLTPSTAYVVHVKSVCGGGDESNWSQNQIFTTSYMPDVVEPTVVTLQPTGITESAATLHGEITDVGNQPIVSRGFMWKKTEGGTYAEVMVSSNVMSYYLNNLDVSTSYTYRAFARTANGISYGGEVSFTTTAEICPAPVNINQLGVTSNSLMLVWTNQAPANEWEVRYRIGGGSWESMTVSLVTYCTIPGLVPNTIYEVQVRAICDNEHSSEWSSSGYFTTTGLDDYLSGKIVLYPNPAQEIVNVQCTMNNEQLEIVAVEVLDVYGKLINTIDVIDNPIRIDVSGLAAGMYFVRVTTDAGTVTKTFVKN